MKDISIIVPCYNCEQFIFYNLRKIIKKIEKLKINYELILINDGSKDDTEKEIKKLTRLNKKIKFINQKKNLGKSSSIINAFKEARNDYILLIDCDIPYFDYFEEIINKLTEGFDLVLVNRRLKESNLIKSQKSTYQKIRGMIGNLIGFLNNYILNLNLEGNDTQAGLKGFKKIKNFSNIKFLSKMYFLDLELIYLYIKNNKKIYSIAVNYELPKISNIKLISLKNFLILYELIKILIVLKFRKNF